MKKHCEFFHRWSGSCEEPAVADIPYGDRRKWLCAVHYDIIAAHYREMFLIYGETWASVANL